MRLSDLNELKSFALTHHLYNVKATSEHITLLDL